MKLSAIKPFIPSGKDFEASKAFFQELGLSVNWEADGYAELQLGDAVFVLQAHENQVLQENFMLLGAQPISLRRFSSAALGCSSAKEPTCTAPART
jgi:hypothetical protein